MNCRIGKGKPEEFKCDALIAFQYEDGPRADGLLPKVIKSAYENGHFKGNNGELFQIYPCERAASGKVILVGLGKKQKSNIENIRKAAGQVTRTLQNLESVAFLPLDNPKETIPALLDGVILGNYRFDRLKSEKKEIKLSHVTFFTGRVKVHESVVTREQVLAEGTCSARDLTNLPANLLTPSTMADEARKLGAKYKIPIKILDEAELKKSKMGSLLAVARGSANRPRMVIWDYMGGRGNAAPLVFVGKGVTFDSGGISIKPGENMEQMKSDMSGAGAVITLMSILGQLKPKINVIGITPLVENLPSGSAYRPGDILTASNGKTIEVITTDAEGRLILADALVYAKQFKPRYVIDIATLTGACVVALGNHIAAGVMGTDQRLIDLLIKAGNQAGERLWQLPLWEDYKELLSSPTADMKNTGGRWGGAITAASFLSNFAEGYPWAHLDIAGMDFEDGNHPYRYKGGTGWGVRLLSQFILNQAGR